MLFDRLGIDYRPEGEVYGAYPVPSGLYLYGGRYPFARSIESAPHLGESAMRCGRLR